MSGIKLGGILLKSGIPVPSTPATRQNTVAAEIDLRGAQATVEMVYCLMDLSDSLTYGGKGITEIERVAQAGKEAWHIATERNIPFTAIPFSSIAQVLSPLSDQGFDMLPTSSLACGGTALEQALELVDPQKKPVVIIVTDGQPNSPQMVDLWLQNHPAVPVYVVGMGTGVTEDMLAVLARSDKTRQAYCPDAQTVKTKLEQFVVGGGSIAVDDSILSLQLSTGIEPLNLYRAFPKYALLQGDWNQGEITVNLGAIGGRQAVCVDLIVPEIKKGTNGPVVKVRLEYTTAGIQNSVETEIEIPYLKKGEEISVDSEIAKWVEAATRARRVEVIDRLARQGKQDLALKKAQELVGETRRGGGDLLGPIIKIMKEVKETGRVSDETRRHVVEELSDTQRKKAGVFDRKLKDEV